MLGDVDFAGVGDTIRDLPPTGCCDVLADHPAICEASLEAGLPDAVLNVSVTPLNATAAG